MKHEQPNQKILKKNLSLPAFSNWKQLDRTSVLPLQKRDRFTLFSTLFSYTPHPNCGFCNKSITLFTDYLIYLDHSPLLLCEACDKEHSECKNCMALIPFSQYTEIIPFCALCKKSTRCHCCSGFFLVQNVSRISHVPGIFCNNCIEECTPCIFCQKYKHDDAVGCSSCERMSNPQSITKIAESLLKNILCSFPYEVSPENFPQEKFVFISEKNFSIPIFASKTFLQLHVTPKVPLHFFVGQATMLWFTMLIKKSVPTISSNEIVQFTATYLTKNFLRENNISIRKCLLPSFWKISSSKEFVLFRNLSEGVGLPKLLSNLQENVPLQGHND